MASLMYSEQAAGFYMFVYFRNDWQLGNVAFFVSYIAVGAVSDKVFVPVSVFDDNLLVDQFSHNLLSLLHLTPF